MYPFPKVQGQLYAWLLEADIPVSIRLSRMQAAVEKLEESLVSLEEESVSHSSYYDSSDMRGYWHHWDALNGNRQSGERTPAAEADKKIYREKAAFFDTWFLYLLQSWDEEAPASHMADMSKRGLGVYFPWQDGSGYRDNSPAWTFSYSYWERSISFQNILLLLWENRNDKNVLETTKKFLAQKNSLPSERLQMVSMSSMYPGRSVEEYKAIAPYLDGIDSMNSCWSRMSRGHTYGLSFGGCEGAAFDALIEDRESAERIPMSGQEGPGIAVTDLDALPSIPENTQLYMVFQSDNSIPDFWGKSDINGKRGKNAELTPIFTDGVLYYMESGPKLLRLDMKNAQHKQLVDWYLAEGAAEGNTILLSSREKPKALAAFLVHWYTMLWESEENEPKLVFTFPSSGNFLQYILSDMKGRAAGYFMGPVTALWYLEYTPTGQVWHEARPEKGLKPVKTGKKMPVLVLSYEFRQKRWSSYVLEARARDVVSFVKDYPDAGLDYERGYAFVLGVDKEVSALDLEKDLDDYCETKNRMLFWRVRGTALESVVREMVLTKELGVKPYDVLNAAEKLVDAAADEKAPAVVPDAAQEEEGDERR